MSRLRTLCVFFLLSGVMLLFAKPSAATLAKIQILNQQLQSFTIEDFPKWGGDIDDDRYSQWAKRAAPAISEMVEDIPIGFVFQVTGHSSKPGPWKENIKISTKRAKFIYKKLRQAGVKNSSVVFKGIASTELLPDIDEASSAHRRVTFVIISKQKHRRKVRKE